ncbi:MAG: hypothetical protein JW909_04035 [Planctomycetes bacterium]|nr:hypothetical protein [Planctomycetota bacterium]
MMRRAMLLLLLAIAGILLNGGCVLRVEAQYCPFVHAAVEPDGEPALIDATGSAFRFSVAVTPVVTKDVAWSGDATVLAGSDRTIFNYCPMASLRLAEQGYHRSNRPWKIIGRFDAARVISYDLSDGPVSIDGSRVAVLPAEVIFAYRQNSHGLDIGFGLAMPFGDMGGFAEFRYTYVMNIEWELTLGIAGTALSEWQDDQTYDRFGYSHAYIGVAYEKHFE